MNLRTMIQAAGAKFLDSVDLSNNLQRMTRALKSIPNGWIAVLLIPIAVWAAVGFGVMALGLDYYSTWMAFDSLFQLVQKALMSITAAGWFALLVKFLIVWTPLLLTMLPTLTEMLGARFAVFNIAAVQWAVWTCIAIDLISDAPHISELLHPLREALIPASGFAAAPWAFLGGWLTFHLFWVLALVAASYFLELLTVLMGWAAIGLFLKGPVFLVMRLLFGKRATRRVVADDEEEWVIEGQTVSR